MNDVQIEKKWYRLTTDPNIRDEFHRYVIVEKVGDEVYKDAKQTPFDPPQFAFNTFMVHQEKDNNGTGFPVGDWWERDRFEVFCHILNGHWENENDWRTDQLRVFSGPPAFLQWELVDAPDELEQMPPGAKALVVRNTEFEPAHMRSAV